MWLNPKTKISYSIALLLAALLLLLYEFPTTAQNFFGDQLPVIKVLTIIGVTVYTVLTLGYEIKNRPRSDSSELVEVIDKDINTYQSGRSLRTLSLLLIVLGLLVYLLLTGKIIDGSEALTFKLFGF